MENVLNLHGRQLPSAQRDIETTRCWATTHLEPVVSKHWEEGTFPPDILQSFRENCLDLLGFPIPVSYGGKGRDLLTSCLVMSTLASVDASFTTTLCVQYGLCAESILLCGNERQKSRLLPGLAGLDSIGCFCLTEPQSGSDASNLRTKAVKVEKVDGSSGVKVRGYAITGSKRWIGNALTSEVFIVWARNTSIPGDPIMGFIVQRSQQDREEAIVTSKITRKASMRILQNADVEFKDAWCPEENVMDEYVGFAQSVGRVLESSRIYVAWLPVGMAMGALEKTIEYVKSRDAFRAPISSNQLIQEKLARMTGMTCSMYLLAERMTRDFDEGKCGLAAVAMAKAYNSRVGRKVVALSREILGGNGIVLDFHIASKFADMESVFTYEGSYDINSLVCGRAITGVSAIKSGLAVQNQINSRSKL